MAVLVCPLLLPGCSGSDSVGFDFDLGRDPAGWEAGFADYPVGEDASYGLEADHRALPAPLETARSGLYIAGTNHSDDLWMQYRSRVSLAADRSFLARFEVEMATNVPRGCGGVGGAPGEDVTVKAGVSVAEPDRVVDGLGFWRLSVDKGQQTNGGKDAAVIGDLAGSRDCEDGPQWELKSLQGSMTFSTDSTGSAWLFVGTDSGFEARSEVFYTRFRATFEPM